MSIIGQWKGLVSVDIIILMTLEESHAERLGNI